MTIETIITTITALYTSGVLSFFVFFQQKKKQEENKTDMTSLEVMSNVNNEIYEALGSHKEKICELERKVEAGEVKYRKLMAIALESLKCPSKDTCRVITHLQEEFSNN